MLTTDKLIAFLWHEYDESDNKLQRIWKQFIDPFYGQNETCNKYCETKRLLKIGYSLQAINSIRNELARSTRIVWKYYIHNGLISEEFAPIGDEECFCRFRRYCEFNIGYEMHFKVNEDVKKLFKFRMSNK